MEIEIPKGTHGFHRDDHGVAWISGAYDRNDAVVTGRGGSDRAIVAGNVNAHVRIFT